jgi:hypothetical protein
MDDRHDGERFALGGGTGNSIFFAKKEEALARCSKKETSEPREREPYERLVGGLAAQH